MSGMSKAIAGWIWVINFLICNYLQVSEYISCLVWDLDDMNMTKC